VEGETRRAREWGAEVQDVECDKGSDEKKFKAGDRIFILALVFATLALTGN